MSKVVAFRLRDDIYAELEKQAKAQGISVAEWIRGVISLPYHPEAKPKLESQGMSLAEWCEQHIPLP